MDNSDIQEWQLDGTRAEILAEQRETRRAMLETYSEDICDPAVEGGMAEFYRTDAGILSPDELRAWTTRYVSSPRHPADGGCL